MIQDWRGKRVTVMGLGRFGGGVGVTRWLAAAGARVTVTDRVPKEQLAESVAQIADLDITLHLGGHLESDFRDADVVVVNPAVVPRAPHLAIARDAGVPISTEINLFVERCAARCVGVTGSVGKSTITAMVGHVLEAGAGPGRWRRVWVGGNIGRSLLDGLDDISADDIVVLELSSFQLERTPLVAWSPHVAVLTNVTPNHLDWHGEFEAYAAAKMNIARFQDPQRDTLIVHRRLSEEPRCSLPAQGGQLWNYGLDDSAPAVWIGDEPRRWPDIRLDVPGMHNRENAAAAIGVAESLGMSGDEAATALAAFQALPHRLQRVHESGGVTWYDDSKCTTPEAAQTAMQAIDAPLLMILGGYDKGSDLVPLAAEVARRARFAACIGTTGPALAAAISEAGGSAERCGDLVSAVAACRQRARPGDAVLLSPACASWDQFVDYRARGKAFARAARAEAPAT